MNEKNPFVFVVDDDASIRESIRNLIRSAGINAETFASAQEFLASPHRDAGSCLVLDVQLPGLSGLDLQQELAKRDVQIPIIFITGHGDIPMSVRAMKAGAIEFLTKPFRDEDLLNAVEQAIKRSPFEQSKNKPAKQGQCPKDRLHNELGFSEIVGQSALLRRVLMDVKTVAPTDSTVLVYGETGTGKELIARAIHNVSGRSTRPFVKLNCGAIPSGLLESELFGHEKGAFTGAMQRRLGRFELADGGTIFLDEVGELPPDTQVALLRVLQEREFERVGGERSIQVDVRVIAATHRDLKAATASGVFREDLFYRLNVFPIEVPPLRERKEDILMLVEYFLKLFASRAGKIIPSIDKKTLKPFQSYSWPGNIRELQNVIERAVILSSGDVFSFDESWLPKESAQTEPRAQASQPFDGAPRGEREIIKAALAASRGRVSGPSGAAVKLGIPPSTLEYQIKALKIRKSQFKFR